MFGDKEDYSRKIESALKVRAQKPDESIEFYIQDVLNLCRQLNPNMSEEDRVGHLMKGVADDIYRILLTIEVATTVDFTNHCRRIEKLNKKRISSVRFERIPSVATIKNDEAGYTLKDLIREIVKEELLLIPKEQANSISSKSLEEKVLQRAEQSLSPIGKAPVVHSRKAYQNFRRDKQYMGEATKSRKTDQFRTEDNIPICFYCNRPGHVAKHCWERRSNYQEREPSIIQDSYYNRRRPGPIYMSDFITPQLDDFERSNSPRRNLPRSSSPYPGRGRSTTGRYQSRSPVRIPSRSPHRKRTAEFLVHPSCSHDVILGWDFLESSSAIIDCGQSEISFSEMPNEDPSVERLYLASDDIIPPKSIKRVVARTASVAGIKNCVIEGSRKLLLEKELFIPSSCVTIWHGQANIWVTNFSKNQIPIPSGMCLAQFIKIQPQEVCPIVQANENCVSKGVESTYKMSKLEGPIENLTNIDNAERPVGMENISSCISPELPPSHKIELLELLERFSELFNPITKSPSELITKHKITTGDARPLKRRPYRVSPSERKIIQEEVDRMMEIGVVQPSESPWASPVVLVRKIDGSVRFCVDYRGLNKVTKKDVYPLPRVDDALDCLKGAKIYSTLDLKSGYWQISVDEADREKTAFITPDGLFEFKVMPFGLCNAPATFERMMDGLLKGLRWTICLCYLDDVVVFADSFSDHLTRIEAVLNCFKKVGLRLNPSKCSFGASKIKILGHQVDQNGIRPDEEKIKAITEFPAPNNLQQVRSFLGLSSYYRRFVRNYADIARTLNALLSMGTKFEWNTAQEGAFRKLKTALTSEPVLGHFDDDAPTELHTDASGYGIGAVLVQKQGSDERVIAYASGTLLKAEQNYSTTERECLAIIWAIGKFRPYLFGRHFRVVTDHHSLCWLTNLKDPAGRLARWALRLQEYDVSIVYKTGRMHQDADGLSRNPLKHTEENFNDDIPTLFLLSDIGREQENDPYIAEIIRNISQPSLTKQDNKFKIVKGILYRKNYDPTGQPLLLVVPRHLRMEILSDLHDAPTAGHLGFAKTYDRVKRRFYWPGLYRSVKRYVGHCQDCQRRKGVPQLPPGYLKPIPPPDSPFQKVGIDLLGRFPISQGKNKWIVVCTDYLTKYAVTQSLRSGEAQEIAKFLLEDVLLKHGAPREIVMDRGRNFQSKLLQELTNKCGIKKKTTTAYHPQTNGLTERLNRTISDMLSMYMDLDQKNWDEMLPFITFAYNTAKQESTGFTPFFLIHGREAETTLDTIFPYSSSPEGEEFIQNLGTRAEEARQIARHHIFKAQETNKTNYDARHTGKIYEPGDLVWIFIPIRRVGFSEKLLRRYFGPFRVTKKISDVTYEVEAVCEQGRRQKKRDTVHIFRMKPYYDPSRQEDSSSTRNLDTINAIKPPINQKTLQSFLGAVNVYNKFIPDYARLRAPLNKLLKKDVKWNWDPDCQQAFTTLKESLTSKPVLHLYQVGLPCRLYCDASTQGIAGILKQVHPDGQVHPVQYFSRALRAHERNYTVSELECLAIVESVDKFRIYLTERLFRWSLRLSTYNYEIHYLKGSQQYEADLLSRNPFVEFVSADIIKQHQPTASPFNIDTKGLHTITRKGVIKIIIPETLQHTLMNKVHQEYNHPGISQMTRIITAQYYWKGISKSIEKFVKSCHTCQIIKRPEGKPYGALGQIPPPQQPFDLTSIDTIAGFSKYGHSKTYLHVIVDHLTRYAWTFPSKSTSTLTYIQTLKTVLQQGSPKRLLSDRAPAFTSEKFRKFLITHGIQPLLTTSNNPQANGLIERLNATITGKLRLAYLENPKASWTQLVKRVTQTYNNTPHSVTSFPPTYLMFNVIPPDLRTHLNPYPEINIAREIANSRTQNKHKKDKETFDKQHRTPHFEVNDLVLVKNYRHPDTEVTSEKAPVASKIPHLRYSPHKIEDCGQSSEIDTDRINAIFRTDITQLHERIREAQHRILYSFSTYESYAKIKKWVPEQIPLFKRSTEHFESSGIVGMTIKDIQRIKKESLLKTWK
ncbi:K02A2.6-like [Cordylochernes scorpioides]|uniref:RNA-directed DNA polymerase n=1 Tax=Cordylochernes scorpioides TaxID=51811 RepID=A0ABY6LFL7_9ARAC|nr:K02A2.6-like [Cordylochernes scorpioides]